MAFIATLCSIATMTMAILFALFMVKEVFASK